MSDARAGGVRPEIRAFAAYTLAPEPAPPLLAKLDFNESPFDVPADVKELVLSRLRARRWSVYPEFGSPRLKAAIARSIGRSPDEVVVGNGSGEVILAAVSVLAGGGRLLLSPPTFSLYAQMAAIVGAERIAVARRGDDFELDEEAYLAAARAAVPLLCSPNNPTGGVVSRELVARVCVAAPAVLLDQAYVDFAEPGADALPLLDAHPNLVIFRTLSKAFSAAGFRIGYAVARPELAVEIGKAVLPFSVDLAAEELALAVLENQATSRRTVATIVSERERVAAALRGLGAEVARSSANFLFFRVPGRDGAALRAGLLARGVLVRDMTSAAPGRLRVTIGTPEENDTYLHALEEQLR